MDAGEGRVRSSCQRKVEDMAEVVRLLNNEEVAGLLDLPRCIEALEVAFSELGHARAVGIPRKDVLSPIPGRDVVHGFKMMGGVVPGLDFAAGRLDSDLLQWPKVAGNARRAKLTAAQNAGIDIGKENGFILLYRISTGQLVCMMTDGELQRARVGLTSALSTRLLARPDSSRIACLGSGYQAEMQLLGLNEVLPLRHVSVYSPRREHREEFASRMGARLKKDVRPVESAADAVSGADVIMSATNSLEPTIDPGWVRPGVHVSCVTARELPAEAIDRCDVVVVTSPDQTETRIAGEVEAGILPRAGWEIPDQWWRATSKWSELPTLGELVAGKHPGRSSGEQATAYVGHGAGVQFVALGALVYEAACKQDVGFIIPAERVLQRVVQT